MPRGPDGKKITWSELDWVLPPKPPPEPPPKWLECKLLGSKIGTENDIKNRKAKSIAAMKQLNYIFISKLICKNLPGIHRINLPIQCRTLESY